MRRRIADSPPHSVAVAVIGAVAVTVIGAVAAVAHGRALLGKGWMDLAKAVSLAKSP